MKFLVMTLGCRLNQAESDLIVDQMRLAGFYYTKSILDAEICIINTCSVTHKADRESKKMARSIKNNNPNIIIVTCGCSQLNISEINLFVKDKSNIVKSIKSNFGNNIKSLKRSQVEFNLMESRVRANIKIQEGCNNYCTYCIVPYLRGKSRSISSKKIINAINHKVMRGHKEIILSGVNIGKFDDSGNKLTDLIDIILERTKVDRIRLSSINPEDVDNKLLNIFKRDRVCNHIHLSLQSGSDTVLKRMGRKYSTGDYLNLFTKIKNIDSNFGITSDVIVGFPGETEAEFNQTCKFVKKIGFLKIHVFKYSSRKGTAAERMNNKINGQDKNERSKILRNIATEMRYKFIDNNIGRTYPILFENINKNNEYTGYSPNYIRLKLTREQSLTNIIKKVKINKNNIIY